MTSASAPRAVAGTGTPAVLATSRAAVPDRRPRALAEGRFAPRVNQTPAARSTLEWQCSGESSAQPLLLIDATGARFAALDRIPELHAAPFPRAVRTSGRGRVRTLPDLALAIGDRRMNHPAVRTEVPPGGAAAARPRVSFAAAAGALLALLVADPLGAARAAEPDFLPVEQAFEYAVQADDGGLVVSYNIRDGYYLYRKRIGFATDTAGVTLGATAYPKGVSHQDPYFGEQEVYRGSATFRVPYTLGASAPTALDLKLRLQGCADAGLCYPPQLWTAPVALPAAASARPSGPASNSLLGKLVGGSAAADEFLPPEQAFQLSATGDGSRVRLHWLIADGYYLYRARIHVTAEGPAAQLGEPEWPAGLAHRDDYFGEQQIYRGDLLLAVPYARSGPGAATVSLQVVDQGCADAGLCYPPQTRLLSVALPSATAGGGSGLSEQDRMAGLIRHANLLLLFATFFGFGLLLSFTPCVLPMVPILAGIIAGDGERATPARSFALSLAYVGGMAVTYTVAGVAFALAGRQAQAVFQQTWILVLFAALFVALAFAMFGAYELQMPAALQTRFAAASNRVRGGRFISTALMGALSSLVVTACVAPPLVAAFAVIGQAGDIVRGALALASLSLGMGMPLLVVGASAGRLLPKAGPWMETVKAVFGVVFLGVAAWMLERVLGARLMMVAWVVVLAAGVWVALRVGLRGKRLGAARSAAAVLCAGYGTLLLVSAAAGGSDPLRPFAGTGWLGGSLRVESLPFRAVKTAADLDREVAAAGRPVLLDFYADWCVSCKEMESRTFRDPLVRQALGRYLLLKADVTANDADDQALLRRFAIFGPPTTAFFGQDGRERRDFRLVGFVTADALREHLARFEASP